VPKPKSTKSPLKAKPVRQPGQSLGERRLELFEDYVLFPVLFCAVFFIVAFLRWMEVHSGVVHSPWLYTAVFLAGLVFLAYRFIRVLPLIRNLRQGEAGEKIVGEYLERLRERGYQVFHDVLGESFNVDHVLIGPAGIFSIETKTWSKPVRGEPRITFDGQALRVLGSEPDRNPVVQARAQAGWLRGLLEESTGRAFQVHPVILIPGWFIDSSDQRDRSIWVLEPKALPKWLNDDPPRLSPEDVKLAAYHLSRHVRSQEKERERIQRSFWHAMRSRSSNWD
jgi:hypothetical protein